MDFLFETRHFRFWQGGKLLNCREIIYAGQCLTRVYQLRQSFPPPDTLAFASRPDNFIQAFHRKMSATRSLQFSPDSYWLKGTLWMLEILLARSAGGGGRRGNPCKLEIGLIQSCVPKGTIILQHFKNRRNWLGWISSICYTIKLKISLSVYLRQSVIEFLSIRILMQRNFNYEYFKKLSSV